MMRLALVSDVHGNLPALQAALEALKRRGYDMLLSLGDEVGFGPSPAQCCALLEAEGALRIRGNHERRSLDYVKGLMPEAADVQQWATLRWQALHTPDSAYALPDTRMVLTDAGGALLIHWAEDAAPHIDERTRFVFSGHIHSAHVYRKGGVTYIAPGSVGFSQQGMPFTATCAIVTMDGPRYNMEFIAAGYDGALIAALFDSSGLMEVSPITSRIILESLRTGADAFLPFLRLCAGIMRQRGLSAPAYPDDVWQEAARIKGYGG